MRETELKFRLSEQMALQEQRLKEDTIRRRAPEVSARDETVRRMASDEAAAGMIEEWRKQQEKSKRQEEKRKRQSEERDSKSQSWGRRAK